MLGVMSAFLGQMRVRVLETLYSMELRHHEDDAESTNEDKGRVTGSKVHATSDWLCAWLGSEHLCVNVSCRFEDSGSGQVQSRLSHSFHLLNATGILFLQTCGFIHRHLFRPLSPCVCWMQAFLPAAVPKWDGPGMAVSCPPVQSCRPDLNTSKPSLMEANQETGSTQDGSTLPGCNIRSKPC